ncbi:hypothetical protein AAG607_00960 [Citromicrobium bathyomarinum]|uniref:hypothetical protein n=1 Tax=Citromicrobium bathyomarinum TaxID=72174 RepID=UPI00315A7219
MQKSDQDPRLAILIEKIGLTDDEREALRLDEDLDFGGGVVISRGHLLVDLICAMSIVLGSYSKVAFWLRKRHRHLLRMPMSHVQDDDALITLSQDALEQAYVIAAIREVLP